jgi:hypothetical protein
MRWALYLLFLAPFWETKPAADWSAGEVKQMFRVSPWAQAAVPQSDTGGEKDVYVYLGSALPMREAEEQRWKQGKKEADTVADEYQSWIKANAGKYIVLTVEAPRSLEFSEGEEVKVMQKETSLHVDKRRYKLAMYFPPSSSDDRLRFAFPREISARDKKLRFEFYVPSIRGQFREAEFNLIDLKYKGQPEF